ncbi:MAG: hypothetical protein K9G44_12335, partial [Melioribacteraceae bacterium]|nr:hypothetical protein [Melioribacteraceae bacterium]
LPGFAWLYFNRNKFDNNSLLQIGKMLLVFVPVLILFYSYLPIRASSNPFLNWGNAVNFENIFRHISGTQYRVWLFSSFDSAGKQLQYFITSFPSEFAYIGLLPAIWGAINLFKNKKDIFWFWMINFSFTILYSINYDIHDIDSYFLLAFITVAAFASIGILHIFLLANSTAKYEKFLPHSVTIIVLLLVVINFKKNDNSNNYIFEDYTKTMINSVEENAVIFSYQWDYFLSASLYYQFVENYRRDVIIVDKELLRRSWYFNQLEACYPGLFKGLEKSKQVFTEQLQHFERDEPYNPQIIEQYYRDLMTNFVSEKLKEGEFYIGPELFDNEMKSGQFTLPAGTTLVPHLFLYKVVKENRYYEAPLPDYTFRETDFENKYTENLKNFAAIVHTNRALYELQFGFENKAALYTKKAVEISKNLRLPVQLQKLL